MLCLFGRPQLTHHGKEFYPPPVPLVVPGNGGRPHCRLAHKAVPVMGLLRQSVQVVVVRAYECGAEGGLLVHEPGLSQVPHRHGCLGIPGARANWAQTLVEVLCCPGPGMVQLRTVPCAHRSTLGGILGGAGVLPRRPFPGARIPHLR